MDNYEEEGDELYYLLLVQVLLPDLEALSPEDSISAQGTYERMLRMLNVVDKFEVQLCFVNAEDKIAYHKVWRFTVDVDSDQPCDWRACLPPVVQLMIRSEFG